MESEKIIRAVLDLWDDFPTLVGSEWTDLYPQVAAILDQFRKASEAERVLAASDLVKVFLPYPEVRDFLNARKAVYRDWDPLSYEHGTRGDEEPDWKGFEAEVQQRLDAPVVTRYSDVTAPRRLAQGEKGAITVGLTRAPSTDDGTESRPLVVQAAQTLEIHLLTPSPHLEILGEPVRRLLVQADADTDPVVFYIKGSQPGTHRLILDFRQAGATVGTLPVVLDVVGEEDREEQQSFAATVDLGGPYVPPVDLDLRVTTEALNGRTAFVYVLHSPNGVAGFHYKRIQGPTICGSPEAYQAHLLERVKALGGRRDLDNQPLSRRQVEDRLQAIGHQLFDELFAGEMRTAYRRFRDKVCTLQITSEEPWIPWEMVKPFDASDPSKLIDDDFLCARFQMTRWLAGQSGPSPRIQVGRLACVEASQAPGQAALPFTTEEHRYLSALAASSPGLEDASPRPAGLEDVESLLDQGGVSLWHFATHGGVDLDHPDDSGLLLMDGRKLRAGDLRGPRQVQVSRDRPLVFLNACRVGQQGWSLAGLGGWASAWVERCHCGLFIGPLWAVSDEVAFKFAQGFYEALRRNHTVGQALAQARSQARELAAEDPTWLAYSVYAHPNARVTLPSAPVETPQSGAVMRGG